MERKTLFLKGSNIEVTLKDLSNERQCLVSQPSPDVTILIFEEYFFRTNSNLMAVIVAGMKDDTTCEIEIISGGGGQGFLGMDWGSEGAMLSTLTEALASLAEKNGQELTMWPRP